MPYTEITKDTDTWRRLARRVLLTGPPNSGKTTSLATWPRPIAIVSFPGELGLASLPQGPDIKTFAWGDVDQTKPTDWIGMIEETRRTMADLIISKKYATIAGDGLHKLYWGYQNFVSGGTLAKGGDFEYLKLSPKTNAHFFEDVKRWLQTGPEYMVFTVWVDRDKDDPNDLTMKAPSHIFPALTGKAGRDVVGEFSVCLYAKREGYGGGARYVWLTQPDAQVWGIGTKLPLELAKHLPPTVPQDWKAFEEKYLTEAPHA